MRISRSCRLGTLNWEIISELEAHLQKHAITVSRQSFELSRYPDEITFDNFLEALTDIRNHGEPKRFHYYVYGKLDQSDFSLGISRFINIHDEEFLLLKVDAPSAKQIIDDVSAFLGLESDAAVESKAALERTAFLAHRFDPLSEQVADRLARFLELLGFEVQTGRGFSPSSVASKVRRRIESQAILFVIRTPGEDPTWLTQEAILGWAKEKPIFLLVDTAVEMKSALLGDLEYIPFTAPNIDTTFIPVLEGLRELNYLDYR